MPSASAPRTSDRTSRASRSSAPASGRSVGWWPASDEHEGQDRSEQTVEHDGFRQREAEPLDALQFSAQLRLPRDRLDHRAEDVPDADPGAERAEADAEREPDRLTGFGDVA